jgi:hypothetical protein
MRQEKEQIEENSDRIEWLKTIYAEWKEKQLWEERQLLNEFFEREKYIVAEPKDLNFEFEERWQCDFLAEIS